MDNYIPIVARGLASHLRLKLLHSFSSKKRVPRRQRIGFAFAIETLRTAYREDRVDQVARGLASHLRLKLCVLLIVGVVLTKSPEDWLRICD